MGFDLVVDRLGLGEADRFRQRLRRGRGADGVQQALHAVPAEGHLFAVLLALYLAQAEVGGYLRM